MAARPDNRCSTLGTSTTLRSTSSAAAHRTASSAAAHRTASLAAALADGTTVLTHKNHPVPGVSSSVPPDASEATTMLEDCDFHPVRSTTQVPGSAAIAHTMETVVVDHKPTIQIHL